MKSWMIVGAGVGVMILVASLLRAQATPAASLAAPSAAPGRYQITSIAPVVIPQQAERPGQVWMVDTQTGDVWNWEGGGWLYRGNPTKEPGVH